MSVFPRNCWFAWNLENFESTYFGRRPNQFRKLENSICEPSNFVWIQFLVFLSKHQNTPSPNCSICELNWISCVDLRIFQPKLKHLTIGIRLSILMLFYSQIFSENKCHFCPAIFENKPSYLVRWYEFYYLLLFVIFLLGWMFSVVVAFYLAKSFSYLDERFRQIVNIILSVSELRKYANNATDCYQPKRKWVEEKFHRIPDEKIDWF